jgi:hypothetical protein
LKYAPIFESRGLTFSIFVNPATIGTAGKLAWSDLEELHLSGHEIANHTMHHITLIDDRAIALRYVGAEPCSLAVTSSRLRTWVGGLLDLDILLSDPEVAFLSTLSAFLDADVDYEAQLLFAPDTIPATSSQFLDPVSGLQIGAGAPAETLTTERGVHDEAELVAEIMDSGTALESHLQAIDPGYRCRTLAYPNHGHTQWAMSKLNELGYLGARSGGIGEQPFYSEGAYGLGFTTTYEVPLGYPRPQNSWTETTTRSTYLSRMITWKAKREWTVMMSHHEGEADSIHVEWMLDTISSDPQIWIAPFHEVMSYVAQYYVDVGFPVDESGTAASAWIHGLPPDEPVWIVITSYNDALEESGWSEEIEIPAAAGTSIADVLRPAAPSSLRAVPNPFARSTSIEFEGRASGPVRASIWNLEGRRVRSLDLGLLDPGRHRFGWDGRDDSGEPLAAGVYWVRIESRALPATTGKVTLLR